MSALARDIRIKSIELQDALHILKFTPSRVSPHAIGEADLVLLHAESLLASLADNAEPLRPAEAESDRCRAVDTVLLLDYAIRMLKSP